MQTWYVATTGSDENDCATVNSPCATIMGALNRPGFVDGDRVLVAEGVYRIGYGDPRYELGVHLTRSVSLIGGWDSNFIKHQGVSDIENKGRGVTIAPGISVIMRNFDLGGISLLGLYNEGELSLEFSTVYSGNESGFV